MSQWCACGGPAENGSTLCARCEALHVLGLTSDDGPANIESAWRMLAKVWHPDRFPGDEKLRRAAEDKLKAINAAHAWLISNSTAPRRPRTAEPPVATPEPKARPSTTAARPPQRIRRFGLPRWCVRGLAAAFFLATLFALLKVTDLWLLSQPQAAPMYSAWRANLARTLAINWNRTWGSLHAGSAAPAQTAAPPHATGESKPPVASAAAPIPHARGVQPYVTLGLSRGEVEAALGPATASSVDRMIYGDSVVTFQDGRVSGWRISAASPLRVKLWPSLPQDPEVTTFGLGSTRDEVVALQGTPSLLTAEKLGYGRSEVFFDDGHVIGWKNDPSSVPLKVPAR